jgi:uncharacterized protein (DUF608 family)
MLRSIRSRAFAAEVRKNGCAARTSAQFNPESEAYMTQTQDAVIRPTSPRTQRVFTGDRLREIAFPIGGIGTGTVSLGGRGQLRDWEIFNRPGKGKNLPYTFFALHAQEQDHAPVARVLERRLFPPFSGGFGPPTGGVPGLPRLKYAHFRGEYPFAWVELIDSALPVAVTLEAYSPFCPLNERESGMPLAIFKWTLSNTSTRSVDATVAFSLLNVVGHNGKETLANRFSPQFGGNRNAWVEEELACGIFMDGNQPADAPGFGSMIAATTWKDVSYRLRWERAGWWDDVQSFWDEFRANGGRMPSDPEVRPSPTGQSDVATLSLHATLEPNESVTFPFLLGWHFPNLTNTWNDNAAVRGKRLGNWYASEWKDALDVARHFAENRVRLRAITQTYHAALWGSTLPDCVRDAVGSNASILRTTSILRTEDGRMNGFEGCGDQEGCCAMNCTHVWNYSQTVAYLFPPLERSVRRPDFEHNTRPDGDMAFRTLLPLVGELWAHKPAADGQMGAIMRVYREWLQCGDLEFLKQVWPGVVRALEFAWQHWDPDCDGVMEGEQHNTYDIEFYGPNTMTGCLYLGALRAAEEMANILGEPQRARGYRGLFESGRKKIVETLWNGYYYEQVVVPPTDPQPLKSPETHPDSMLDETEPRYQYGPGCLSDQLLGQWLARTLGLGDLLPAADVKRALESIFQFNWMPELGEHHSVQRVYALNDEAGLLLCTWPRKGRPRYPFPYADEVWTGIEYQVAAHCIYEGLLEEGLAIVKGVRDRHDGLKRNPWNEFECGHHYVRAMSSWSLLLALSGYSYDASTQHLGFAPKVEEDWFQCFFSAGSAWGEFGQTRLPKSYTAILRVHYGLLPITTLSLPLIGPGTPEAELDGRRVDVSMYSPGNVLFLGPLNIAAGGSLVVRVG